MTHVTHLKKTLSALAFGALLLTGADAASYAQEADQAPKEGEQTTMQGMEDCPMMGEDTMEEKSKKGGEATSPQKEDGEGDFRD